MEIEDITKQKRRPLYSKVWTNSKIGKDINKNNRVRKSISQLVNKILNEDE